MEHLSGYLISPIPLGQLEEVARLVNSAYRGESSQQGWTTEAHLIRGQRTDAQTLLRTLQESSNRSLLGLREQESGPILGTVMLERFEDSQGIGCYLGMLTVNPTLQARGLGKALLLGSEHFARKNWHASRMTLGVIQYRTDLIAWYERHGYCKTGGIKPFPYGDPSAGQPLRNDLHLVMFEKMLLR